MESIQETCHGLRRVEQRRVPSPPDLRVLRRQIMPLWPHLLRGTLPNPWVWRPRAGSTDP
eukprot:3764183-Pyramimonas_sp.AAC.1